MTARNAVGKNFRFRVGNGWQIYDKAEQTKGTRIRITQNIRTEKGWSQTHRVVYPDVEINKI